jgi:hypothetical protein
MLHSYCITISLYFVMVILCVKRVYLVLLEGQASCTRTNEANQSLLTTEEMKRSGYLEQYFHSHFVFVL